MAFYITDEQLEELTLNEKFQLVERILGNIGSTEKMDAENTYRCLTALGEFGTSIKAKYADVQADFDEKVRPFFEGKDVANFGKLVGQKISKSTYDIDYEALTEEDYKNIVDFVKNNKTGYKFDIKNKNLSEANRTQIVNMLESLGLLNSVKVTYGTFKKFCDRNGLSFPEIESQEISIDWSLDEAEI